MTHVLVLGTAEWDQAIATNQHYAVRELSEQHEVTYVESMGLRRVELTWRDARRIWGRLRRAKAAGRTTTARVVPTGARIVSPVVVPYHRGPIRVLNAWLLRRQVRPWLSSGDDRVLWLYTPVTYGLDRDASATVYHCVDLLGTFPGIDAGLIERAEADVALAGAVAAGSSPAVVEHLVSMKFELVLSWPNVADLEVFGHESDDAPETLPQAVFAGNLTARKVDFDLLRALLQQGVKLHLAGPVSEGGGADQKLVDDLMAAGAVHHGLLSPAELAHLYRQCTVGLIPYVESDYTQGVSPLKTYEYLAAGLAVVSTGVPSVAPVAGDVVVCEPRTFVPEVVSAVSAGVPNKDTAARRRAIASDHGWSARGEEMRRLVDSLIAESGNLRASRP
ncbi:glycosyltransferase [Nocardioides pinisoli]|uniref:Glycosyltransferase n=1 Tax=Nocardioides pinisoli TaxID=2950279 RepID=A0ABT1KT43_9ACTN|nr:glycosyltransferase [Nocardioides pinisoli]MCP3420917.1 glycosyltransferase [Nocardioides pinisoli]